MNKLTWIRGRFFLWKQHRPDSIPFLYCVLGERAWRFALFIRLFAETAQFDPLGITNAFFKNLELQQAWGFKSLVFHEFSGLNGMI